MATKTKRAAPKTKAKPAAKIDISPKRGRKKAPIETRRVRSSNPHKNRIGPPDLPKTETPGGWAPLPMDCPKGKNGGFVLCELGREKWDDIVSVQLAKGKHGWLSADDVQYVLLVCERYARYKQTNREANFIRSKEGSVIDIETNRPHAIFTLEKQLSESYAAGLRSIGFDPSQRRVVEARDEGDDTEGLA